MGISLKKKDRVTHNTWCAIRSVPNESINDVDGLLLNNEKGWEYATTKGITYAWIKPKWKMNLVVSTRWVNIAWYYGLQII